MVMLNQKEKSTFLITSSANRSFGTGFCIYRDDRGSYIVTCAHVVDECGGDEMLIDGMGVQLKAKGDSQLLDLAILYVDGFTDAVPWDISLSETIKDELTPFEVRGFKPHKQGSYKLETLYGEIEKVSTVYTSMGSTPTYELNINGNDSIEKGYSGSAVVCASSKLVIAVATDRNRSGKEAYAIPLYNIKSIWKDIPRELLEKKEPPQKKTHKKKRVKKPTKVDYLVPFGVVLALLNFIVNRLYPLLNLGDIIYVLILISAIFSVTFVYLRRKLKEML